MCATQWAWGTELRAAPPGGSSINIRPSKPDDVTAITSIYAHHVLHGLASFEATPPSADEMATRRREIIAKGFPYLVAEKIEQLQGDTPQVLGYAYASLYRTRPAYRYTLEDSIYLHPDAAGRGIGTLLLTALLEACEQQGARQVIAIIGDSANHASIKLHAACGFTLTGTLHAVGFKFGRWVDSVIMQKALGAGAATLPK